MFVGVLGNVAASHLAGTWVVVVVPNYGDVAVTQYVAVAQLIHLRAGLSQMCH